MQTYLFCFYLQKYGRINLYNKIEETDTTGVFPIFEHATNGMKIFYTANQGQWLISFTPYEGGYYANSGKKDYFNNPVVFDEWYQGDKKPVVITCDKVGDIPQRLPQKNQLRNLRKTQQRVNPLNTQQIFLQLRVQPTQQPINQQTNPQRYQPHQTLP
jgi:hypothetical protein